jgi:hypothetical protein
MTALSAVPISVSGIAFGSGVECIVWFAVLFTGHLINGRDRE